MNKYISLGKACRYSFEKIKLDELTLGSYITTDNILQNKQGVTIATNLPPQGNSFPKYYAGSILVGNIRPYLKKIWFADNVGGCSADVLVFDVKNGFYPKFVYYAMFQDDFFVHAMKGSKGTKMPRGDKNQLMEYQIPDIDFKSQKQIADVLTALDSKIALNNRINAELEAMAKTVYDYWFVQFNFPAPSLSGSAEEGLSYKSSGGKMVWSEELKREVPEGWEVKKLFDEMNVQYGFPFSTDKFSDDKKGKPIVRIRDILENTISTYSTENVDDKYMLNQNDLLIGMDGNFHLNFWDKTGAYLNQRSVRIRSKEKSVVSNLQAYFELTPYIKAREKNTTRTTVGHLSDKDLKSLYLLCPNNSTFKPRDFFDSILNKITTNRIENQQLSSLRDWLLPMLMNGQVRVGAQAYAEMEEGDGLMAADSIPAYKIPAQSNISHSKRAFAKQVLGGKIVKMFKDEKQFTNIKFQKIQYLAEQFIEEDLDWNYYRQSAGPYDNKFMHTVFNRLDKNKWFKKSGNIYFELEKVSDIDKYYQNYFGEKSEKLNVLFALLQRATEKFCEAIATIYAVWNNHIILKLEFDKERVKADFFDWSNRKTVVFTEEEFEKALAWMQKHEIVPTGFGNLIKVKK